MFYLFAGELGVLVLTELARRLRRLVTTLALNQPAVVTFPTGLVRTETHGGGADVLENIRAQLGFSFRQLELLILRFYCRGVMRIEVRAAPFSLHHFFLGMVLADGRRVRLVREYLVSAISRVGFEVAREILLLLFKQLHFYIFVSDFCFAHGPLDLLVVSHAVLLYCLVYLLHFAGEHVLHLDLLGKFCICLLSPVTAAVQARTHPVIVFLATWIIIAALIIDAHEVPNLVHLRYHIF